MDKNVKRILWITGILVVLVIGLTIYSCISGNYEVGGYFSMGIIATLVAIVFIGGAIYYLVGLKRLHDKKKGIEQENVIKRKALPLYSKNTILICICYYIVITLLFAVPFINSFSQESNKNFDIYFWAYIISSLVGAIVFYIKLRQSKMLYLIKDSDKILKYEDNVDDSPELFMIHSYLGAKGRFVKKKCEQIELSNNIKIWSCFSKETTHHTGSDSYSTWYYSFIIASECYDSINNIDIEINNSLSAYLNKDNQYITKYSNLPPFLISGEYAEDICNSIEEICSDFFSKTRSRYVLIIRGGTIGLGLKSARFGRINRIFNRNKTAKLTKEAIEEIENFLLRIKNALDRE